MSGSVIRTGVALDRESGSRPRRDPSAVGAGGGDPVYADRDQIAGADVVSLEMDLEIAIGTAADDCRRRIVGFGLRISHAPTADPPLGDWLRTDRCLRIVA